MNKNDLILVIDMQNVYLPGEEWACPRTMEAAQNILRLLDHVPDDRVIFSRFVKPAEPFGRWKTYNEKYAAVNDSIWLNELVEPLKEAVEDKKYTVYDKSVYSLMKTAEVHDAALAATAKGGRIVLTGVVAECCVLSTAFEAIDLGCEIIYVTDAVAGLDEPKEKASELTLSGLSPVHTHLCTTDEYIASLGED
ncbi:MAG: isochorismatase family cysteine hydrolase [Eubacteriales bacterium]|jgi:nicotinamidase-related amidase